MSKNKKIIPWKVQKDYDLNLYPISKKAERKMNKIKDFPNIKIDLDSKKLRKNFWIYNILVIQIILPLFIKIPQVLKRQIHLLYDFICDPEIMKEILKEKLYLALKKNIFSLTDFENMRTPKMRKDLTYFYK